MKKKITYLDTLDAEAYVNDLQETLVKVNRSAATVKGGRRFSFNALSVVGNRSGVVGFGFGKARQVPGAIEKAAKDAGYGATMFVTRRVEHLLEHVCESPAGRVPKKNPDRTISTEGRTINDMRIPNSHGQKENHPPANQSRHHQVARQSLWWSVRHPFVPQRITKRDVNRAFKWTFLDAESVSDFAYTLCHQ